MDGRNYLRELEVMGYEYAIEQEISTDLFTNTKGKKITDFFQNEPSEDIPKLTSNYWKNDPVLEELINSNSINYSSDPLYYKGRDLRTLPKETIKKLQEALIKIHQLDPKNPDAKNYVPISDEESKENRWGDQSHSALISFKSSKGLIGDGVLDKVTMIQLDLAYAKIENQVEFEKGKVRIRTNDKMPWHFWEQGKLYNSEHKLVWSVGEEFDKSVDDFTKQTTRSLEAIVKYMNLVHPDDKERVAVKMNLYLKGGKAETSGLEIVFGNDSESASANSVIWNPYAGIYMANQNNVIPPFIVLYHEIVHSYLTFVMGKEKKEAYFDRICDTECKKNWGDAEEREVISKHEAPLSKVAGFGVRTGYGGTGKVGEFLTNDIWKYPIEGSTHKFLLQAVQPEFMYRTKDPLSHDPEEGAKEEIRIARELYEAGTNNDVYIYRFDEAHTSAVGGPGIYLYNSRKQTWKLLISKSKMVKE